MSEVDFTSLNNNANTLMPELASIRTFCVLDKLDVEMQLKVQGDYLIRRLRVLSPHGGMQEAATRQAMWNWYCHMTDRGWDMVEPTTEIAVMRLWLRATDTLKAKEHHEQLLGFFKKRGVDYNELMFSPLGENNLALHNGLTRAINLYLTEFELPLPALTPYDRLLQRKRVRALTLDRDNEHAKLKYAVEQLAAVLVTLHPEMEIDITKIVDRLK